MRRTDGGRHRTQQGGILQNALRPSCGACAAQLPRAVRAAAPCLSHVSDAAWENAVSAIQAAPDDLTVRMGLLFCAVEPEQAAILCPDAKTAEIAAQLALYADAPLQALPPVIRRWLHTLGPEVLRGLTLLQAARARSPRRRRAAG